TARKYPPGARQRRLPGHRRGRGRHAAAGTGAASAPYPAHRGGRGVNVTVVLDTSALLAYARLDGLAVGELIAMVEEDAGSGLVGVPGAGLRTAHAALARDERARLVQMAPGIDGVTVILPLLGADPVEAAKLDSRLPKPGSAHAIIETRNRNSLLATYTGVA